MLINLKIYFLNIQNKKIKTWFKSNSQSIKKITITLNKIKHLLYISDKWKMV